MAEYDVSGTVREPLMEFEDEFRWLLKVRGKRREILAPSMPKTGCNRGE
jgi:hypothetical protein